MSEKPQGSASISKPSWIPGIPGVNYTARVMMRECSAMFTAPLLYYNLISIDLHNIKIVINPS